MDIISILATVILFTTIGTLAVAVAAYIAFKLRDKRRPKKYDPTMHSSGPYEPVFLKRYVPGGTDGTTTTTDVAAVKK
jgi:heme/copper-type cytochrome/quinol oxidase subunit 2